MSGERVFGPSPRGLGALLATLACVASGGVSGAAWADDTHYQDYLVGSRSVGLGGAFAAISDDPSGIFYNPAGIVDARHTSVQLSTNLYGFEVSDSLFAAVGRVADLDTAFTDLNIIPASASFTTIIEADADGRPTSSYGLGVFVPAYRSVNVVSLTEIPEARELGGCTQVSYQRSTLDRTFLAGGSLAHRIDDTWRFGISGILAYRSLRDREETSCFTGLGDEQPSFATAESNLDLGVASLLFSAGLKADLGGGFSLGLTVTTPSITAFDFADVRVRRGNADAETGRTEFLLRELLDLRANSRFGTQVRLGAAYAVPRRVTLAWDVTFHAPVKYRLFAVPAEEQDVRQALTLVSEVERRMVLNTNLGAEYLLTRSISIAGGLFTNFSSAPRIPGDIGDVFTQDYLPFINSFGGTLVAGFFSEYTLTRVGVMMSYGEGTDVVPRSAALQVLDGTSEFVKVPLSQAFAFLFVSSTFRY